VLEKGPFRSAGHTYDVQEPVSICGILVAGLGLHGGASRKLAVVPEGCLTLDLRLKRVLIPPSDLLEAEGGLEEYSVPGDVDPYPESIGDKAASPWTLPDTVLVKLFEIFRGP